MVVKYSFVKRCCGGWAHYLSAISEGPLPRGWGPIATSVSASGEKPSRCLPLCCMDTISSLEPGPPWNKLMKHMTGEVRKWDWLGKIRTHATEGTNWKEDLGTGLKWPLNSMWPTSCAQEGYFVFSQATESDLWSRLHNAKHAGAHTQAKIHTVSFSSIPTLGGIFISKGSDLKSGHILHSKGEPEHKTHRYKHMWRRTELSYCEYCSSQKSKLIQGSQEILSCLNSEEQLKEHIPSTEHTQIIQTTKSNKWMLASFWRKLFPWENKHF